MAVRSNGRGPVTRRRMNYAFWFILTCYLFLVARLVYLQLKEGPGLLAEAIRAREQNIPVPARRGDLLDRNGEPLAVSLYAGTVGFDPRVSVPPATPARAALLQKQLSESVHRMSGILGQPEETLKSTIAAACAAYNPLRPVRFVTIAKDVPIETAAAIRNARPRLIGFGIHDGSRRNYAAGPNAAQVVGFTGADDKGAAGLERSCGLYMRGRDGVARAELDNLHRAIPYTLRKLTAVQEGLDVHTTLDSTVQLFATEEAEKIVRKYHPRGVSVVAVDPLTGDVLGLVSLPNFDPNPGQHRTVNPEALADRCASRLYEPGSTLKALTIAAALDDGTINENSTYYCSGQLAIGNKVIHCAMHGQAGGHGLLNPKGILQHSCNVGAAQIGMKMGPKSLFSADRKFGILDRIEVGLPGEQRGRLSFDRNERIYTNAKAARVAFGHSIATTPLHVAMAYAALANGGTLMRPRLISSVTDSAGHVVLSWKPQAVRRAVSKETSRVVCDMLRNVVTAGTGKVAAVPGYQVAGKTGTANKYRKSLYVGSFIGFLPASENARPRVVILVAVDEPKGGYYGAEVAAPAFQAIARRLMDYWQVPKDDPEELQAKAAAAKLPAAQPVRVARRETD